MYSGKLVFAQLMEHLPLHTFRRCVQRYPSKYPTKTFSHLDQFLCLAFAQLTYLESLRDIETCLRGNIPTFIHITDGKMHKVNVLDILVPEAGSFYIMDRGFTDIARWFTLHQAQAFFVIRGKSNPLFRRVYSRTVDKSTGLRCDQTIAQLYRCRWRVELFFKWIKQHLRIKRLYGSTENAVKTQIWIAIAVYVLVAILKKRLKTEASLYTILQILSLTLFEKISLDQLLKNMEMEITIPQNNNQLNLFN